MNKVKFKKYVQVLLTEAVKINNSREAYDLIMNKKIGAKVVDKDWFSTLPANESMFLKKFDDLIEKTKNNSPFAFQLAVNKLSPTTFYQVDTRLLSLLVNYKNKDWAKQNDKYKELITLNNKLTEMNYMELDDLATDLENESDNHGKKAKGSGSTESLDTAYDKNGWTLYIAHSWQAAKAASFYGKRGEKNIPTEWCTRADLSWYNKYTLNNTKPLYIIRNYNTGKAYQMAVRPNIINFLDQEDVKGDEIAKGDLSKIPEDILKLIKLNDNKTLLDYKHSYDISKEKINKKLNGKKPINDISNFKDINWSNPILINRNPNIYKQRCTNYVNDTDDHFNNYNKKGKVDIKFVGNIFRYRLDKTNFYYYVNNELSNWYKIVNNKELVYTNASELQDHNISIETIIKVEDIALKDSGHNKNYDRKRNINLEIMRTTDTSEKLRENSEYIFNDNIEKYFKKIDPNCSSDAYFEWSNNRSSIMPTKIILQFILNREKYKLSFSLDSNKLKYIANENNNFENIEEVVKVVNNIMKEIYKRNLRNKTLNNNRINNRAENSNKENLRKRLQFEDYFPY